MVFDSATFHYPPELLNLLVQAIPLLCKSKMDVVLFFKGAGVKSGYLQDIENTIRTNRDNIKKFEIAQTILQRLNERGDSELATRREIIKRIVEFDSFAACWESDVLKAKGAVAEIQKIVGTKDSFTRMRMEREKERSRNISERNKQIEQQRLRNEEFESIKNAFFALFPMTNAQQRGVALEKVLNRFFKYAEIGIIESFSVSSEEHGVFEQIDGAVEIDGIIYLVEMKWRQSPTDVNEVSRHLVRMFSRSQTRGIFISASNYTAGALKTCEEALRQSTIVLCTIQEFVLLFENRDDIKVFFKSKIRHSTLHKKPFVQYTGQ